MLFPDFTQVCLNLPHRPPYSPCLGLLEEFCPSLIRFDRVTIEMHVYDASKYFYFLFFLFYPPKNIFRHLATMPYTPLHTKCRKDKQHQKVQSIKYFSLSRIRFTHAPVPLLER